MVQLPGRFKLVLLVGSVLVLGQGARATTVDVQVGPNGSMSFDPDPVTIQAGDTVNWIWGSSNHSVRSGTPSQPTNTFSSGTHNTQFSFQHTFPAAGNFPYYCEVHTFSMTSSV